MELKTGIGFSQEISTEKAVSQAIAEARVDLQNKRIDLAFILSTPHHDPRIVSSILQERLGHPKLIGSSTSAVILNKKIFDQCLLIALFSCDALKCDTANIGHIDIQDCHKAGKDLIAKACKKSGLHNVRTMLSFFDGSLTNVSQFKEGLTEGSSNFFPIIAAGHRPSGTNARSYQFCDDSFITKGASALIIGGGLTSHIACRHGWRPLGQPRHAGKSRGTTLQTIDGKSAATLYEEFLNFDIKKCDSYYQSMIKNRYPLGVFCGFKQDYILRQVLGTTKDGGLICDDSVPKDAEVHIMISGKDSCLRSATQAAEKIKSEIKNRSLQVLFILESSMRYNVLKRDWTKEISAITEVLGSGFPIVGGLFEGELFDDPRSDRPDKLHRLNGNIILLGLA